MPKHEFGTVYVFTPTEEDRTVCVINISRKVRNWTIYETPAGPQEPGRHRASEPEYWSMTCDGPCCV